MSAAIAMAPSPAPHERPSYSELTAAPTSAASPAQRSSAPSAAHNMTAQSSNSSSPKAVITAAKSSPPSASRAGGLAPKIIVKKEPASPSMPNSRPRPRRLDLSKNTSKSNQPATARPLTARDNLGIQEVGIACLSPGFVTQDPVMKEQLQRSMSVREQQRHIIEARLHQQSAKGDGPDKDSMGGFAAKTPGMSRRNRAPPGLSIVAPSHEQFANERVIQSAPLGHSFTGRQHPAPMTRHIANQPSNLSSTSHIHHVPANQTNNRLPPISDVFGQGLSAHPENAPQSSSLYPNLGSARGPPLASPGLPPPQQAQVPTPGRPREYRSAEEAQQDLAGGRPELLPKLVHYGGHQPPTPPSPAPGMRPMEASRSASKRRTRAEYEDGSPPLGHGPAATRRGPFGAGRDSPETQKQKKEEFMRLCDRAWDLFHS
ncbi:hypothetical protein QQX98_006636 [Neonectria punicea]|uniref:Uncharacterized protein n=1 Tax=Neonectria punicea TaxID=979145 RepID=A0ABR1H096_9HYPO